MKSDNVFLGGSLVADHLKLVKKNLRNVNLKQDSNKGNKIEEQKHEVEEDIRPKLAPKVIVDQDVEEDKLGEMKDDADQEPHHFGEEPKLQSQKEENLHMASKEGIIINQINACL